MGNRNCVMDPNLALLPAAMTATTNSAADSRFSGSGLFDSMLSS